MDGGNDARLVVCENRLLNFLPTNVRQSQLGGVAAVLFLFLLLGLSHVARLAVAVSVSEVILPQSLEYLLLSLLGCSRELLKDRSQMQRVNIPGSERKTKVYI